MEIITREEAQADGLKRYFTGKPCIHGHESERYVSNKGCVECRTVWVSQNREYFTKAQRQWRKDNREHHRQYMREYMREYRAKARNS